VNNVMRKFAHALFFIALNAVVSPAASVAESSVVKNDSVHVVGENVVSLNKAISDACQKIGVFLGIDTRVPKLADAYKRVSGKQGVYKSQDWTIEVTPKEITAKAYFKEKDGSVSEFGKGDVEVTLKFEFEYDNELIKNIVFYSFNFERNIIWVDLLP
jgi:hypothetical protein